jgi:alkanesulfonate monooxygenase SsuD/methylene tetrahydromethanopterin reductase-like flavin-dependent oxidoreductase (luciferase family)
VSAKLGVTLPSFVEDPEIAITVARAAEAAGVDAVFAYDHVFRDGPTGRRPALECFALLGAVAAETVTIGLGTLVARATLRPPATLAHCFDTVQRVSGGRLVAGIGSGDSLSRAENEMYAVPGATMPERVDALHDAVRAATRRGYPVWVGGHAAQVRELVAEADGWNEWGSGVESFARDARFVREVAPRAELTWGGVVSFDDSVRGDHVITGPPSEVAARLRAYVEAGAHWLIAGPYHSSNPENATILGEVVRPLLAG